MVKHNRRKEDVVYIYNEEDFMRNPKKTLKAKKKYFENIDLSNFFKYKRKDDICLASSNPFKVKGAE